MPSSKHQNKAIFKAIHIEGPLVTGPLGQKCEMYVDLLRSRFLRISYGTPAAGLACSPSSCRCLLVTYMYILNLPSSTVEIGTS